MLASMSDDYDYTNINRGISEDPNYSQHSTDDIDIINTNVVSSLDKKSLNH